MIHITLRRLSGLIPMELDAPFTAEHLREEIVNGELEWELDGKGVEYLSLYTVEGRCLLDDDSILDGEEYMLFVHTIPIQRYYLEDTDEVLELEIGEHPTVDQVYDVLVEALWEREEAEEAEEAEEVEEVEERQLCLTLRVGGMHLLGWDEAEPLTGREITVQWREREHPWEWE
jgi:hypothetical protein